MTAVTAAQARAQLEMIAKRLSDGYTDREIMKDLNIKRATFYNYKAKLFKQYGDVAAKKSEKSLEFEAEVLKDRYIRLYRQLELRIAEHPKGEDLADVALATEVAAITATNIFKLETEGLRAREGRPLRINEQKAMGYIRALPVRISEPDFTPTANDDESIEDPNEQQQQSSPGGTEEKMF